jgi:hypothetical protein
MKSSLLLLGAGMALLLAGCASPPVGLGPVGPSPFGNKSADATGHLQVFSRLAGQRDDQSLGGEGKPSWYAHADYNIYKLNGKLVEHVGNTVGHYSEAPKDVALPAGLYYVMARSQDYARVRVIVRIEPGRTTRVHLDDKWKPGASGLKGEIVTDPNGSPVGWLPSS